MKDIIIKRYDDKLIVTLLENGKIIEKYEEDNQERLEGNIYLGKVKDVLPGMQAAFVDIGKDKNAFIHVKDVFDKVSLETGNRDINDSDYNISDYLKQGQYIVAQVKRDSNQKKGAKISAHLNISGEFVALMPNAKFVTVSQKIDDENEIKRLKSIVNECDLHGHGIIIRTSAQKMQKEKIEDDIEKLIKKYDEIIEKSKNQEIRVLYENQDLIERFLKDIIYQDINKVIINDNEIYAKVEKYLKNINLLKDIKLELKESSDDTYQLEKQLEKLKERKIWLNCGGFITIDKTEALTAIDVNSGKYIGGKSLEQTVAKVNAEAAIEIAKQLRLRDIGGIIIIDFIDMQENSTREKIIELFEKEVKKDRSKVQVVGFTKLDLLEITRKHIRSND